MRRTDNGYKRLLKYNILKIRCLLRNLQLPYSHLTIETLKTEKSYVSLVKLNINKSFVLIGQMIMLLTDTVGKPSR